MAADFSREATLRELLRAGGVVTKSDLAGLDQDRLQHFVETMEHARALAWHDGDSEILEIIGELIQDANGHKPT